MHLTEHAGNCVDTAGLASLRPLGLSTDAQTPLVHPHHQQQQ